jgi:hypothetical protein
MALPRSLVLAWLRESRLARALAGLGTDSIS